MHITVGGGAAPSAVSVGAPMAHVAAVLGALGAPLLLVPSRRALVLAGLGLIAARGGACSPSPGRAASRAARAALGLVGLAVLGVVDGRASCAGRSSSRSRSSSPRRSGCRSTSAPRTASTSACPQDGEIGRLLPLYGFVVGGRARARLAARARRASRRAALPREIAVPLGALVSFASLSVLWSTADAAAQNLLQYFLLPFAVLVAVVARAPFPAWMPRALGDRRRRARGALRGRRPRRGGDAPADLLHARPSRSGTRTRASSASRRSSATRACTAATSCSRSRSC